MDEDLNPRAVPGGNNPPFDPLQVDPEKLIALTPDEISALLEANYRGLADRRDEFLAGVERWMAQHRIGPRIVINDDADNDRTSEFLRQLGTFAGPKGEAQSAFEKVKGPIFAAGKVVDGWKHGLIGQLGDKISAIDAVQTVYLREKAAREKRLRDEQAKAERDAAEKREKEARDAIAKEEEMKRALAARAVTMAQVEKATAKADEAIAEAQVASERADIVEASAQAPLKDLVRSRSALGTTTTLRTTWDFRVTNMRDLCRAIADGRAPEDFVITNDPVIKAAIRGDKGRRDCPGLDIFENFSASRRGA
jgi:hypothetical protein